MKDTAATIPSKITASDPSAEQLKTFKDERAAILETPVQEPVKSTAPAAPVAKLNLQPAVTEVKQVKVPLQPRRSKVFPNPPLPQEVVAEAAPAFVAEPIGEDAVLAGAVSATVAKVPVQTLVGNITNVTISPNFFGINRLTDGSAINSWTSAARQMLQGDVTLNELSLTRQLQHGYNLNQSVLDEDRAMTVMGLDWREIQLLTEGLFAGRLWTLVPQRDADKIFIFRDTTANNFDVALPTLDGVDDHYQFDGFKAMFVNLATADRKLNILAAAGDVGGHSGTIILSRGACVVLRAIPRALRTVAGQRYILSPKFGSIA